MITDLNFDELTFIKYLKSLNSPYLAKIEEVYGQVKELLNTRVPSIFPKYTLHNTEHSFRVMEYMSKIVGDCSKFNQLEITLMIYAALLHDIGMAVSEDDIELIKADRFPLSDIKFSAMMKLMGNDECLSLQEYVRRIHATLSGKYIREKLKDKMIIPSLSSLDFANELAQICECHTENYDWIRTKLRSNEVRGDHSFNPQYIGVVLRLSDLLDIDSNRTPYDLYRLIAPKGVSDDEWKQHFVILNNEKIVLNEKTQQKKIVFYGKATNASIHRKILIYIGWVETELTNAIALVNGMESRFNLFFDTTPEVNIQAVGYSFSDYKMTLEFRAISSLLMGEKIYGSRSLGLRELIQNSIDACRLRQESDDSKHEFGHDVYKPKIKVIIDKERQIVTIKDNGIGMTMDIIKKHFLNIGVSYYNSNSFLLKDYSYKPIGNFGIGFLSCFMLSNEVKVITRNFNSKNKYLIELERGNEWTSLTEEEDVIFDGTEVILNYSEFMEVFDNNPKSVNTFLNKYFLTDKIEFELVNKAEKSIDLIINPTDPSLPLDKGLIKIDLHDYLNDFEGYVLIKRRSDFVRLFEDIGFDGEVYKYSDISGVSFVDESDSINIDDYINGNEIKFLSIPIVDSTLEDDFLNGLRFTENDVSEVIEKFDRELNRINVIVKKDFQDSLSDVEVDRGVSILENFSFKDLVLLGHSGSCLTKAEVKTITLFEGEKNNLYLPFDIINSDANYYWWRATDKRKDLFIRNVLIKDFRFNIPISTSIFEINTIVANISSRKLIPDISRNNVDLKEREIINYVIGKAIHIGAADVLTLEYDEKITLNNFISAFYNKKSEFEK